MQISDENVHRVRCLMDEVFKSENFVSWITYRTTTGMSQKSAPLRVNDFLLWYAKDREKVKFKRLFMESEVDTRNCRMIEDANGERRSMTDAERSKPEIIDSYWRPFRTTPLHSKGEGNKTAREFAGKKWTIPAGSWRYAEEGFRRLGNAGRIMQEKTVISAVRYFNDFPLQELTVNWTDTGPELSKSYVVQTNPKPIQRCLLMTTDPGDLVLDPTCGSGTTAYVAEGWGRRWITIDTSRVAVALARQRLLTGSFDYYELQDKSKGVAGGFINKTVPHITLKNIAQNTALDPDWPPELQGALTDYRAAWRAKMDEVNNCIAAASDSEELVDQPEVDRKKLRVSGPFTVEAVQPAEESLHDDSPIGGEPEEISDTFESEGSESANAEAYLDGMIRLLRNDGVRFPDNRTMEFARLDPIEADVLHAEGEQKDDTEDRLIAVVFGPQHGPVTAMQVEECLPIASRRGYDDLVFAGFGFDGAAQAAIQDDPNPRVRIHMAHINPDVAMGGLLKETPTSQLFTVFGEPRTKLDTTEDGEYTVTMEGVDIYNPVDNMVTSEDSDRVAAWFIDSDYDGRTFCITQAFFPDKKAWNKIARALKGVIDAERFESFSGTTSLPFPAGEHRRVAVKVIDPRGNEVMRVHNLGEQGY